MDPERLEPTTATLSAKRLGAVTIRQVAREAGVSPAAASKALHGGDARVRVAPERAAHIRGVAKRLNYYPNALARSLRRSRTQTIGLLFEGFYGIASGPLYYVELLDGLTRELFERHYRLVLLPEVDHSDLIGSVADGRMDGVIWCKLRDEEARALARECPIPIVAIGATSGLADAAVPRVACDNPVGIELAVAHLWELGHRRIAFLHEIEETHNPDCVVRLAAFEAAMGRRGLSGERLAWAWDLTEFETWKDAPGRATAVLAWNERSAAAVLERARASGVSVPRDLSVVGFDSTAFCDGTHPPLTAVRQPIAEIGHVAARLLLDRIEQGRSPSPSTLLPCALDVRASTAPPQS